MATMAIRCSWHSMILGAAVLAGFVGGPAAADGALPVLAEGPEADAISEPDALGVRSLGTAEGLPQMTVLALAQTGDGYVYAGTQDGLARWDGVRFTEVAIPAAPRDWVSRLLATVDGLWVGTDSSGLFLLDSESLHAIPDAQGQAFESIEAIAPSSLGGAWVGTPRGLFLCSTKICNPVANSADLQVAEILESSDGVLWVGTNTAGLYQFAVAASGQVRRNDFVLTSASGLPNSAIRGLALDQKNRLWIGTGRGMARWDGHTLMRWRHSAGKPLGGVFAVQSMPDGSILAALWGGGLARFREDDGYRWYGLADGLPDSYLRALLLTGDADDPTIWLGSGSTGALRLDTGRWRSFDERQGLPQRVVVGVGELQFRDGHIDLWAGTLGGAVRYRDGHWQALLPNPYGNRVIYDVRLDAQGRYWYATDRGVLLNDGQSWREFDSDHDGLPATASDSLVEFDGRIWAGTGHGLAEISPNGVRRLFSSRPEYAEMAVRSMALVDVPGKGRRVLIGSGNGALLSDGEQIERLPDSCSPHGTIYDVTPISNGDILLGTRAGAVRLNWNDGDAQCSPVTEPGGVTKTVYEIAEDHAGRIYLFGYDGVRRLDPPNAVMPDADNGYRRFGIDDGLPALEFNRDSLVDSEGRIWAANSGGLVVFNPDRGLRAPQQAQLRLLAESDGHILADGALVPAQHGELVFVPRLLSFRNEHRIRYRTQLVGLETKFSDWMRDGDRRYPRIPHGSYRFEVQAMDAAGHLHGPLSFEFRVDRPWWQHPLALALAAVSLILFGLAVGRFRARALAQRATELEQLVAVRTHALERASNTDPLTQAWNRRYFHARIGSWLTERENGNGLWLLLIDIDHFKQINDRYGHAVGDAVLVEIAGRLQALDSDCSDLIRWGGEEFLLVWRDQPDQPISVRVRAALTGVSATPVMVAGQQVQVSCSIGFTRCRPPAQGVNEHIDLIVGRADMALYRAKEQGRNRAVEAGAGDSSQWQMLLP